MRHGGLDASAGLTEPAPMLKRTIPWQFPFCGVGFALAGLGCAAAFAQALVPDLSFVGLAPAITMALGLGLLFYAYRCERVARNRAALEVPFDCMTALNQSISEQVRGMSSQTLDLVQQRDGFKALVRELSEKQNWLEAVFRQLPAGVLLVDQNLEVVMRNERFDQLLGLPAAAAPKSLRDFHGWPAETVDGTSIPYEDWPLVRALRDGSTIYDQEMRVGIRSGGWFDAAISAAAVRGPQGEPRGGVLLVN